MKNRMFFLITLLVVCNSVNSQNWERISHKIKKEQLKVTNMVPNEELTKTFINRYHQCRKNIDVLKEFGNNTANDTIYIFEWHSDGSDESIISEIWNQDKVISYEQKNKNDTLIKSYEATTFFTKHMKKLALNWDVNLIKEEEQKNGTIPIDYIYLTRIVSQGKRVEIKCIRFRNFFLLERDLK